MASSKSIENSILLAALSRIARVVKPYPDGVSKIDGDAAVEALRQRNLVHGPAQCPNLTASGIEAAQALKARTVKAEQTKGAE